MAALQEIPRQSSIKGVGAVLATRLNQIKSVVASQVTAEKMARMALNELRLNDTLATAAMSKPDSFINAVMQASHLGLEIGGALGQCYLVPFKDEVKAMVGYRGLLTLARRSGFITSIKAEMVYENDTFELSLGIETIVVHKPLLTGDRGKPKLVYMVAHFTDGGHHFEWMSIADVDKIRGRSPSGKNGPWVTDYEQMALKTVIRRGWKFLPMSIEMQKTEVIEHAADTGKNLIIDGDSIEIAVDVDSAEVIENTKSNDEHSAPEVVEKTQMMPGSSVNAIIAEMDKVIDQDSLDMIFNTRVMPFMAKIGSADRKRLDAAHDKNTDRLAQPEPEQDQPPKTEQNESRQSSASDDMFYAE
jgi:recombination protein RecT